MRQFQLIQPEYENERLLGFFNLVINDHDQIFAADVTHDDLMGFHNRLTGILLPAINDINAADINPEEPLGLFVRQVNFPRVRRIIDEAGITNGADNTIRHILAITATVRIEPHGRYNICICHVHIHCDVTPRN